VVAKGIERRLTKRTPNRRNHQHMTYDAPVGDAACQIKRMESLQRRAGLPCRTTLIAIA
jgi:hypothetical protein